MTKYVPVETTGSSECFAFFSLHSNLNRPFEIDVIGCKFCFFKVIMRFGGCFNTNIGVSPNTVLTKGKVSSFFSFFLCVCVRDT